MRRVQHSDCFQPAMQDRPPLLNRIRRFGALALVVFALAPPAFAQLPQARLYSIFPLGGKAGTTFEFALSSGADLDEANRLVFSHPGITAVPKMTDVAGRKQPVPNTFTVTIGPKVPSGVYEVFAAGLFGLSNPRIFVVGTRDEIAEKEPNNDREKAEELRLDRVVNGTISGETDVDCFRFSGKRGQRIVGTCRAADLDSRLSPVLELDGPDGRRLAYSRQQIYRDPVIDAVLPADGVYLVKVHDFEYRGGVEYGYRLSVGSAPYVDYIMPPAGVAGTTHRYTLFGRNLPGGKPAGVRVEGHPLEMLEVDVSLPNQAPISPAHTTLRPVDAGVEAVSYVLSTAAGESNPVLIELAPSVPVLEKEPNDTPAAAQHVTVPCEFAGQFQSPGDTDYVRFEAKAGQVFMIDVFADRLGSTADPVLVVEQVVRDKKGNESVSQLTSRDDENSSVAPNVFETRTDDPWYRFKAPDEGTYRIMLRDRSFESRGEPRMVYRLSIRPENPDFRVVVLPREAPEVAKGTARVFSTWGLGLRKGDSRDVEVIVLRRDGFREPIDVWAQDLPPGVFCRGSTIGPSGKTGELIFTADEKAPEWAGLIRVFAKAHVADSTKTAELATAESTLEKANQAAAQAETAHAKTADAARRAGELLAVAKQAAEANSNSPAVAKVLADARPLADSANKAAQEMAGARNAAAQKQAEAKAARDRVIASTEIVHQAIPAEIVWSAKEAVPAVTRLSQSLALSVMKESAPVQLSTPVDHVAVNQSRQILVPLSLARRNGFDGDVPLTLAGLSDSSVVDVQAKPIPKGKAQELIRLFVKPDARAGTYAFYWKTQAQVSYRRNPFALERASAEQAAAIKSAAEAAAALKEALALRDRANKKLQDETASLAKVKSRLESAKKLVPSVEQAARTAAEQKTRLARAALEPAALAEATARLADFARKSADEALAAAKTASQGTRSEADIKAAAAATVAVQSAKKAEDAAAIAKTANAAAAAAARQLSGAQANAKKTAAEIASAAKQLADAEAALKSNKIETETALARSKDAENRSQAAAAQKTAADQKVADATKVAAPAAIKEDVLSTPIILTIKRSPLELTASLPNGGALKKGAKIAAKINVRRTRGFKGPVNVMLPLPPGAAGIKAEPLIIPAAANQGVLSIAAGSTASPGPVANLVVRAQMDFEGQAEVDAPIALRIVP